MEIVEWQKRLVSAVKGRFPREWSAEDRVIGLLNQVSSVGEEVQSIAGLRKSRQHDSLQHLIAVILVDVFMLCDMFNVNLDKELQKALDWFQETKPRKLDEIPLTDWEMIQP